MSKDTIIAWFRLDLRLADHPALHAAAEAGARVIPVYVLDDETPGMWAPGGASRWWLGSSLAELDRSLRAVGSRLLVRRGRAEDVIPRLVSETGAGSVYVSRLIDPWAAAMDARLYESLGDGGVELRRFSSSLLFEPELIRSKSGGPYRVYSAFARAAAALPAPRRPRPPPRALRGPDRWPESLGVEELGLLPTRPDWAGGLRAAWQPGERGAAARLASFLAAGLAGYATNRDRPDLEGTSRLSPHLHFGELSPNACWYAARAAETALPSGAQYEGPAKFRSELLWREFSHYLLHYWPSLPEMPFKPEFGRFPWSGDETLLNAWQRGRTGYPIVDAGMRELWRTGYMHNRVRMIAASFLVKHLLIPWQSGARWFWDTLVDADLANNASGWQWVAGSGADAAPYFRIFNPVKQGRTFDPDGSYVRRFVPELARLETRYVHAPFEAPEEVLSRAGVRLGTDYPKPLVDHALARQRALAAFATLR